MLQRIKGSNEAESFCQTVDPGRGPLTQPAGKVSGGDSEQTNKFETWKLCEGRTTWTARDWSPPPPPPPPPLRPRSPWAPWSSGLPAREPLDPSPWSSSPWTAPSWAATSRRLVRQDLVFEATGDQRGLCRPTVVLPHLQIEYIVRRVKCWPNDKSIPTNRPRPRNSDPSCSPSVGHPQVQGEIWIPGWRSDYFSFFSLSWLAHLVQLAPQTSKSRSSFAPTPVTWQSEPGIICCSSPWSWNKALAQGLVKNKFKPWRSSFCHFEAGWTWGGQNCICSILNT